MKTLKANLQIILFIVFETAVGIMLLVDPVSFARMVIIIFGILFLGFGAVSLVRFLRDKNDNISNPLALTAAVIAFVFGVVFTFFSGAVIRFITAMALIYGILLAISGILKLQNYFQCKKAGLPVSKVTIISGVLAVIVGIIIALYPKDAAFSVWMLAGILILAEAVVDIVSVVQAARNK